MRIKNLGIYKFQYEEDEDEETSEEEFNEFMEMRRRRIIHEEGNL